LNFSKALNSLIQKITQIPCSSEGGLSGNLLLIGWHPFEKIRESEVQAVFRTLSGDPKLSSIKKCMINRFLETGLSGKEVGLRTTKMLSSEELRDWRDFYGERLSTIKIKKI
jgi:hypothetical protein